MFSDEIDEALDGFGFGDVEPHRLTPDVEVDLARRTTNVAEIGIGHFTRAVHDASHNGDLHAFEVLGAGLNAGGHFLQVKQRAAAAWAGDEVGFERATTGGLQNIVGQAQRLAGAALAANQNGVPNTVAQQRADHDGGAEQGDVWLERCVAEAEAVFQQNGTRAAKRLESAGQQAERGDGGQVEVVPHRDELRVAVDGKRLARIDFHHVEFLVNRFRLHVVAWLDARRELVPGRLRHGNADGLFAAALHAVGQLDLWCCTACVIERVVGQRHVRYLGGRVGQLGNLCEQVIADGDLVRRILGERNADRVAQAVAQQRADADGALDAAVLTVAGLGDAEVQRVIPVRPQLGQARGQQPVALDHHLRVAGLHRELEIVEVAIARDAGELQSALHHAQRRVAVAVHDAVAERAVVGADTQRAIARFALVDEWRELGLNTLQLACVLFVGVFADVEFFGVGIVAGVDAHHLAPLHRLECGVRLKMNVGHDRHVRAARADAGDDRLEIGGVAFGLRGDADNLATHINQRHGLLNACIRVERAASEHGLLHDGLAPAHDHSAVFWITYDHWPRFPPLIAIR